jgi:putative transposase
MAHTYIANFTHYVFSTKDRENTIPPELKEKLWAYLLGIANNLRVKTLAVGGTANHIHMLLALPPTIPVAEAVRKLKANSSRWLGEQGIAFRWQEGYGAFSVSPSLLNVVQAYIRNQKSTTGSAASRKSFACCWRNLECLTTRRNCLQHKCRPCGTRSHDSCSPGTYVPG